MKNTLPEGIRINGVWYDGVNLAALSQQEMGERDALLKKVFLFLKEWFGSSDTVTLQTSGSTGTPKKMVFVRESLLASARATGRFFGLKAGMNAHLCLSPDFVAGKMMIVRAMQLQMNLVTTSVEANPLAALSQAVDFSAMVPLQVGQVLEQNPDKFKLVKTLIIGGGSISPVLEASLQPLDTACWHTYGMTETLTHIALRPLNGLNPSEWFTPLPGVSLETDSRDCLVIHAPGIVPGPVVTNDLAEMKGQQFKILGRIDDVVVSAGKKLHPARIEQKLSNIIPLPFFLAGEEHPQAGQILVIFIEDPGHVLNIQALEQKMKDILNAPEVPRKIVVMAAFKYLQSGKIDRLGTTQ
jgi:o-succinylbenzoate---CoA ligase